MSDAYAAFIASRRPIVAPAGIEPPADLNPALKPHQDHCVRFALRLGRAALFLGTGLGKSLCAIEWGRIVAETTGLPVLILTPLAVAQQFVREGAKFGVPVRHVREAAEVGPGVNVANYERLEKFSAVDLGGVVLDESSILKAYSGKVKTALIERFAATPFRLCCTATPAPNDYMELGNHAEFLGVMTGSEMLSRWFINDTAHFGTYRLKGHAVEGFWNWVCSWAVCLDSPADMGFDATGYALPELREIVERVEDDLTADAEDGALFRLSGVSATNMHREQRRSLAERVARVAALVAAEPAEPWIVWCETDAQADALRAAIPEAVEVRGSHKPELKEQRLVDFSEGRCRVLLTKSKIAGHGLNWQHCARMAFIAVSFSFEQYFQAVRRCWRFGQERPVRVHLLTSDGEAAVFRAVRRKAEQHQGMKDEMLAAVRRAQARGSVVKAGYRAGHRAPLPAWVREAS